jgi:hypothetical protein
VKTTNLRAAIPENSSRNSKRRIAVKSAVFNFLAPGSQTSGSNAGGTDVAGVAKQQEASSKTNCNA